VGSNLAYETYWARKKLIIGSLPEFPVRRWWSTEGLSEIERIYFDAISGARRLLDVGAGDLRVMRKFQAAGFGGEYLTQDVGGEGEYTYRSLDEIESRFDAILVLDVIEHLALQDGLKLIADAVDRLEVGGVLIVQTPNAYYIPDPLAWDMTHLHAYNVQDLWAFLRCLGLAVEGYRVVFGAPPRGPVGVVRSGIVAYVKRRILGCDFANNIALLARKTGEEKEPGGAGLAPGGSRSQGREGSPGGRG
jgi:hypothetical protein